MLQANTPTVCSLSVRAQFTPYLSNLQAMFDKAQTLRLYLSASRSVDSDVVCPLLRQLAMLNTHDDR